MVKVCFVNYIPLTSDFHKKSYILKDTLKAFGDFRC